jgi:predicted membrane chloride channel (bestrophin family)
MILFLLTNHFTFASIFTPYVAIAATTFIAFAICGIEAAGQIIEDPFGFDLADLALDSFCDELPGELDLIRDAKVWAMNVAKSKQA